MFTDDFCEDWDSTRNQDNFIKKYFSKEKVSSKIQNSPCKAGQQESEYSSPSSHLLKNKRSLNYQLEGNKKHKKEKKSLCNFSQEGNSEIASHSTNIQIAESHYDSNVKRKKKKKKSVNKNNSNESSEQMENAEDSNTKTETVIDNFSANSMKKINLHSNEIDSDNVKVKKKRKLSKNKNNSIAESNISASNEAEIICDEAFNDPLITNHNLSEDYSDCNTFKVKKKKKKFKNIDKSNSFSDDAKTINDTVFNDSSVTENSLSRDNSDSHKQIKKKIKNTQKSAEYDEFSDETEPTTSEVPCNLSSKKNNLLQNKAYQKLQAAKFRYLNEMLYTNSGKEALSYFQENNDEYMDYHKGYQSQVSKWPINPVDIIIQEISRMNKQTVIADLGCGEAKIAEVFSNRIVHSFDLIALKDCVTACDMANVPLPTNSVDVVVFCLSLMGTNWKDYLKESQRILKLGGIMKIAEIESRIENVQHFIKEIENFGFSLINQNLSHKMFVFLNFKRANRNKKSSKVPAVTLRPCLYKKR